ncbi:hypothetical protein HY968_04415 [Candidatus Kaiserbacteria bacterium]|nr:hypothetical protein [Candidatus Kaiserbacteria bacterium]
MKTSTKLLATAAMGAAGYYFYGSPHAKKNRKIAAKWAGDLKEDVMKQARVVGEKVDKQVIMNVVDSVASAYETVRGINRNDIRKAAGELKSNWDKVAKELIKKKRSRK